MFLSEDTKYEKSDITAKIIGAAFSVHNELGPHYLEVIYQRALALEFSSLGLDFNREIKVSIYYKGTEIDTRRADFIVENVLVEIKAKGGLEKQDHEQIISYLKSSGFRVGLLINFGADRLEYYRKINSAGNI